MNIKNIWVKADSSHLLIHLSNGKKIISFADNNGRLEMATINKNGVVKICDTFDYQSVIKI